MEIIYYVAISLDGFIAQHNGDVSWLSLVEQEGEDYGYNEFFSSIDAIFMGRKTYEFCLSLGEWPYEGKPTWVFSSRSDIASRPGVIITNRHPREVVKELQRAGIQRAWLVGGGHLAASFKEAGLITEYLVSILPLILGSGIPMITTTEQMEKLRLISVTEFPSGLAQLRYTVER